MRKRRPTAVFSAEIGRSRVNFTRHAIDQFAERETPPDATRKQARTIVKAQLHSAKLNLDPPPWTRIARAGGPGSITCRPRVRRRLRELTIAVDALEAEIADLVARVVPHLLTEPGFGAPDRGQADRRDRRRPAL